MIETPIYKFKKRQLADSPPNIEIGEGNWDIAEEKIAKNSNEITVLSTDINRSGWSVEGSKKIIPNCLFIGGDYNTGKCGCIKGQTTNMPPNVEVGVREAIAYDNNNVVIRVTETKPIKGRIWLSHCDGTNWTAWKQVATNDQIEVLNGELSSLRTSKMLRNTNVLDYAKTLTKNEECFVDTSTPTTDGLPSGCQNGFLHIHTIGVQINLTLMSTYPTVAIYRNVYVSNVWKGWETVPMTATTDALALRLSKLEAQAIAKGWVLT